MKLNVFEHRSETCEVASDEITIPRYRLVVVEITPIDESTVRLQSFCGIITVVKHYTVPTTIEEKPRGSRIGLSFSHIT